MLAEKRNVFTPHLNSEAYKKKENQPKKNVSKYINRRIFYQFDSIAKIIFFSFKNYFKLYK